MTGIDPHPGSAKRRAGAIAAVVAGLAVVGGIAVAGVPFGGEVDEVRAAGKPVETALHRFHRDEDRRLQEALSTPAVLGIPRSHLNSIAECESHGDPAAVSSDGLYRGKFQFDRGTWASVGGSGDPIRAAEPEQDRRAALLIKRSGSNPWPVCG